MLVEDSQDGVAYDKSYERHWIHIYLTHPKEYTLANVSQGDTVLVCGRLRNLGVKENIKPGPEIRSFILASKLWVISPQIYDHLGSQMGTLDCLKN